MTSRTVPPHLLIDDHQCTVAQGTLELVGRRWSSGILLALARGADRFSAVLAMVEGLSDRMLAQRLRELEQADLVERTVVPTTPVQVRYGLTERGASLMAAMQPLIRWGTQRERTDLESRPAAS